MGFVYGLSCPKCGFHMDNVPIGLGAGCVFEHALVQDAETGHLREIGVMVSEIKRQSGRDAILTDQESVDALTACIEARLAPTESWISPGQAVCPTCRRELIVADRGIM